MSLLDWLNDNAGGVGVIVSATGVVIAAISRLRALQKLSALLLLVAALALAAAASVAGFAFAPSEEYGAPQVDTGTSPSCVLVTEASETTYPIGGRVTGVLNPRRLKLVFYAHTDRWYVQPLRDAPYTDIHVDGRFQSETHAGDRYMALLVRPDFAPEKETQTLASVGEGVIAVLPIPCASAPP